MTIPLPTWPTVRGVLRKPIRRDGQNESNGASGLSTSKIQAIASSGRSDAPATEERRARLHPAH